MFICFWSFQNIICLIILLIIGENKEPHQMCLDFLLIFWRLGLFCLTEHNFWGFSKYNTQNTFFSLCLYRMSSFVTGNFLFVLCIPHVKLLPTQNNIKNINLIDSVFWDKWGTLRYRLISVSHGVGLPVLLGYWMEQPRMTFFLLRYQPGSFGGERNIPCIQRMLSSYGKYNWKQGERQSQNTVLKP